MLSLRPCGYKMGLYWSGINSPDCSLDLQFAHLDSFHPPTTVHLLIVSFLLIVQTRNLMENKTTFERYSYNKANGGSVTASISSASVSGKDLSQSHS